MKLKSLVLFAFSFLFIVTLSCDNKLIKKPNKNLTQTARLKKGFIEDSLLYKKSLEQYSKFSQAYASDPNNPEATLTFVDSMLFYYEKSGLYNANMTNALLINANAMYEFSQQHQRGVQWYNKYIDIALKDSLVDYNIIANCYQFKAKAHALNQTEENIFIDVLDPWHILLDTITQTRVNKYDNATIIDRKMALLYYDVLISNKEDNVRRLLEVLPVYKQLVISSNQETNIENNPNRAGANFALGNIIDAYLYIDPSKVPEILSLLKTYNSSMRDEMIYNHKKMKYLSMQEKYDSIIVTYNNLSKKYSYLEEETQAEGGTNHHYILISEIYLKALAWKQVPEEQFLKVKNDISNLISKSPETNYRNYNYLNAVVIDYYSNKSDAAQAYKALEEYKEQASSNFSDKGIKKYDLFKTKIQINSNESINEINNSISGYLKAYGYDFNDLKINKKAVAVNGVSFDLIKSLIDINQLFKENSYYDDDKEALRTRKKILLYASDLINVLNNTIEVKPTFQRNIKDINDNLLELAFLNKYKGEELETVLAAVEKNIAIDFNIKLISSRIIDGNEELIALLNKKRKLYRKINTDSLNLKSIDSLYQNILALEEELTIKFPSFVQYNGTDFSYQDLKKTIDNEEYVIRWYEDEMNVYAVLIDNKQTKIKYLPRTQVSKSSRDEWIAKIYNKYSIENQFDNLKKMLSSFNLKNGNVKIITSPAVSSIPFDLIIDSSNNISLSNSLVFETIKESKKPSSNKLICFSPTYIQGLTHEYSEQTTRNNLNTSLPFALEEATFINDMFKGKKYLKTEANKKNFIESSKNFNMHHLAMHAVVDEKEDLNAKLLFYGNQEEDFMSLNEIYNLNLDSQLVTLSACNTAYGKVDPIEGVMSLSRAFQYAGARATLTSLWRVPDRETSIIMKSFYTHLKNGDRKDVALKRAKQDYLAAQVEEELKHPYYWAGFILTGDTSPVSFPTPWWYYLLGITILGLVILTVKKFAFAKTR